MEVQKATSKNTWGLACRVEGQGDRGAVRQVCGAFRPKHNAIGNSQQESGERRVGSVWRWPDTAMLRNTWGLGNQATERCVRCVLHGLIGNSQQESVEDRLMQCGAGQRRPRRTPGRVACWVKG